MHSLVTTGYKAPSPHEHIGMVTRHEQCMSSQTDIECQITGADIAPDKPFTSQRMLIFSGTIHFLATLL